MPNISPTIAPTWPANHFVRMILVGLAECDFTYPVPDWILEKLRHAFEGLCSTVPVELMNRVLRKVENDSNDNKDVSREKRWYQTYLSDVLKDNDLKPLKITSSAKQAAPKQLPNTMFDAEGVKCSLEDDSNDVFFSSKKAPESLSPAAFNLVPLLWIAAVQTNADVKRMEVGWLALLTKPKMLLRQVKKKDRVSITAMVNSRM